MESRHGQQLGNYRLGRLLGQGAFASVYVAEDLLLRRHVAIKMLKEKILSQANREAFLQEARTIASLRHPHIVRVLAFDVHEKIPFLVMECAPGGSLRYPRGIQLPLMKVLPYVQQMAKALDYAHTQKLIHRDVKPENMLLGPDGEVLLSDFGLVSLVQSSGKQVTLADLAGTPRYMAPEQLMGKPHFASDQYALGIVVYEWLVGEPPFEGAIAQQHLQAPAPSLLLKNPYVPMALDRVVLRALEKDPEQRFSTVEEFAEAFTQAAQTNVYLSQHQTPNHESQIPTVVPARSASRLKQKTLSSQRKEQRARVLQRPVGALLGTMTQSAQSRTRLPTQSQQASTIDFSTVPVASQDSFGQSGDATRQTYLRWLILGSALFASTLLAFGIVIRQPQVWVAGIVVALAGIVLGLIPTIRLNQWFWLVGFVCLSPFVSLAYGLLYPTRKADPPTSMRQLILVTTGLGWFGLLSWLVTAMSTNGAWGMLEIPLFYAGLSLSLSAWILSWVRGKRLGMETQIFWVPPACFVASLISTWDDDRDP